MFGMNIHGEYMWVHLYKRTVNVVQRHTNKQSNKAIRKTSNKQETCKKSPKKRRNIQSIWICIGTEV